MERVRGLIGETPGRQIEKEIQNNRKVYEYDRITLVFPKKYHNFLKHFRDKQLSIHITEKDGSLTILLSENKNA